MAASNTSFESEYSRLLGAIGAEALTRLQASSVLLIGLRGLGVEIAKNLVLFGVNRLTLHDPSPVLTTDLSSNFFVRQSDVGQPRAAAVFASLEELNPRVDLRVSTFAQLDAAALGQFTAVVSTDNGSLSELLRVSDLCHEHGVKFVAADSRGLFGAVFTDLGQHVIFDKNGEPPKSAYLVNISNDNPGVVLCNEGERHDLEDGDWVVIHEVEGMPEVNGREHQVKVISPFAFSIGDTTSYGVYQARGLMTEVKKPTTRSYQSLAQLMAKFEWGKAHHPDGAKAMLKSDQFLLFYKALLTYQERHDGACPRPYDAASLAELLDVAASLRADLVEEIDAPLFRQLCYTCAGDLGPMAAFLGGVAAQEVCKAVTGKYQPIDQFLFFDALSCLDIPDDDARIDAADFAPRGGRYDGQIAVFGAAFHARLANLRYFLVGSGAIGCEMLKNWAMMGVATGPDGYAVVTDMDTIEVSNLNRQFLFRVNNVGQSKSEVAAAAAARMNPDIKVRPLTAKVAPETAVQFPDAFWRELSGVCNALDNVEARKYVDRQCVRYGKSLLESGTLGPKGNTQVVVPHVTESYSSTADPPQASIPICTLHTFPSKIEHTLAWARQVVFQQLFVDRMEHVRKFFADTQSYVGKLSQMERLSVVQSLEADVVNRPQSVDDCVRWALGMFYEYFRDAPMSLITMFPRDYVGADGTRFWVGSKRPPTPLSFDASQPDHLNFVVAAARLRAWTFNLTADEYKPADLTAFEAHVASLAADYAPAPWKKSKVVLEEKNNSSDGSAAASSAAVSPEDEDKYVDAALARLRAAAPFAVNVVDFEKDDDRNFHVDLVHAASNLRASSYEIPTVGRLESKLIAGKIIPAMITTTAVVAGLVCFELYKLFATVPRKRDDYANTFLNLAISTFQSGAPMPVEISGSFCGKDFSIWDRIDLHGNMTFQQLMDHFQTLGIEVDTVCVGPALLWAGMIPAARRNERRHRPIVDVLCEVRNLNKADIDPSLQITLMGNYIESGEDCEAMPDIYLNWRQE